MVAQIFIQILIVWGRARLRHAGKARYSQIRLKTGREFIIHEIHCVLHSNLGCSRFTYPGDRATHNTVENIHDFMCEKTTGRAALLTNRARLLAKSVRRLPRPAAHDAFEKSTASTHHQHQTTLKSGERGRSWEGREGKRGYPVAYPVAHPQTGSGFS